MSNLYVFIDESGDPGYLEAEDKGSRYYAELCLQLNEDTYSDFVYHITNWRYCQGRFHEFKSVPREATLKRYIGPIKELNSRNSIFCSCVYLEKRNYTGPYLKSNEKYEKNPLRFRNFVHRKLLEFHFKEVPPAEDAKIHLVFDHYRMTTDNMRNLEDYLRGNYNLPKFEHICHLDSICADALQVTSQLAIITKDAIANNSSSILEILDFIKIKDITAS